MEAQNCVLWTPSQALLVLPLPKAAHAVREEPEPVMFPAHPSLWTSAWPGQDVRTEELCARRDDQGEHSYSFLGKVKPLRGLLRDPVDDW